ncbi:MAG: glycine--tRNA ligase [Clostridiales Family XIII bacterium]|jgi:glycyl-tRNA synthetase|nr:glycine--tRNA ligase [Clostridiales Family XIII bacterium]
MSKDKEPVAGRAATMEKIVALCKSRGFIYPGSEIYGGLANSWDYGPLGVELKNNIKRAWWRKFVQESPYNVGLDSAIILNREVWVASGHVGGFSDPLLDCRSCKERFRADQLIDADLDSKGQFAQKPLDAWTNEEMETYIKDNGVKCPSCGKSDFTGIRKFNLMFRTHTGVTDDSGTEVFLRPETAQGIFTEFRNVQRTSRRKIPFGIAQVGKSFRNEITPGNFIFRTREFEQMELEFFCRPGEDLEWFGYWKDYCRNFLLGLGIREESIRMRDHTAEELSHYSNATTDIEFLFPFGWGELWGVADRTDFDLRSHMDHSGEDLSYRDPETNEKYIPYCIEPSLGADRILLAFLADAYDEETLGGGDGEKGEEDVRTVLRLHPALAPFKAAVLPLSKKLSEKANEVYAALSKYFMVDYDVTGSIGKRYRREDEIGTPYCITIDFETEEDNSVTVRDRDTMEQVRLPIEELRGYIEERLEF